MNARDRRPSRLSHFARLLLAEWRRLKLPRSGEPIVVAVSGGADSTALLLGLDELSSAGSLDALLFVAHLDHSLRSSSKTDARWVASLTRKLGYTSVIGRAKVLETARERADNLEQAARMARYEFLERTAKRKHSRYVLTAHTMDDQAETILLRLMRGSSGLGLGGMEAQRPISKGSPITLIRPLLWARRSQTEEYCRQRRVEYLADEMNEDERFARVKVRKTLMPLMQTFNNRIVEALSRTATLLREDAVVLVNNSDALLEKATEKGSIRSETTTPPLNVHVLSEAPAALRRRALREWISKGRGNARRLEMTHLLAVEKLLEGTTGGRVVELPNGSQVRRKRGWLHFEAKND